RSNDAWLEPACATRDRSGMWNVAPGSSCRNSAFATPGTPRRGRPRDRPPQTIIPPAESVDVPSDPGVRNRAAVFTLLAAFLWATYYPFVLAVQHHATPSATIVYPFLLGGALYLAYAVHQGQGKAWAHLWLTPGAWLRVGFLVGMQLSVLAATYLIGPVDSSLLSLIGDVVLTPVLVAFVWAHHRGHLGTWTFGGGLVLSLLGGGLTIAGGQSLSAVVGPGWLVVPAI